MKVGDGRRKLGRVVATVADAEDIKESMSAGVCVILVLFCRE